MDQEQTEQQTDNAPATREDLIAAVREAGGAEVEAGTQETAATTATTDASETTAAAGAATTEPTEEQKIAAVLKAREERHRKVREAEQLAQSVRQAAETERARIIREAREEAERLRHQSSVTTRQEFEKDPTAFLKTLADDPQNIVDEVVKQNTPEGRMLAQIRAEAREAKKLAEEGRGAKEELKRFQAAQEAREQREYAAKVQGEFMTSYATEEKAPYLNARYEPDELFARCNALCVQWEKDGLTLGDKLDPDNGVFDRATLVAYLENQSRERYTKLTPQEAAKVGTAQEAGAVAKAGDAKKSANGMRTLSAAQGSERRTSPRPLSEMKPEEARAALIEEVAAARRANPDSTM